MLSLIIYMFCFTLGYFRPEMCTDIKIRCSYVPLPNFDNLRLAYENVSNITMPLDEFVIPASRQGRSPCPMEFPALSEFHWSADDIKDLACPQGQLATTFVCPADLNDLRPKPQRVRLDLWAGAILTSCLMSLAISYMLRRIRDGREHQDRVETYSSTVVAIPKYRRDDRDSCSSNESEGLLCKNGVSNGSNGHYHAISKDSSLERK